MNPQPEHPFTSSPHIPTGPNTLPGSQIYPSPQPEAPAPLPASPAPAALPPWRVVGPAAPVAEFETHEHVFPAPPTAAPLPPVLAYPAMAAALPVNPDALPAGHAEVERQLQGMGAVVQTPTPHDFPLPENHPTPAEYMFARFQHFEEHPEDYERQPSSSAAFADPHHTGAAPLPVHEPFVPAQVDSQLDQLGGLLNRHLAVLERLSTDLTEFQQSVDARFEGIFDALLAGFAVGFRSDPSCGLQDEEEAEEEEDETPATWAARLIQRHAEVMEEFASFVNLHGVRPADFLAGVDIPSVRETAPSVDAAVFAEVLAAKAPTRADVLSEAIQHQSMPEEPELPWRETNDAGNVQPEMPAPTEAVPEVSTETETSPEASEESPEEDENDDATIPDEKVIELAEVTPDAPLEEIKKALVKLQRRLKKQEETRALRADAVKSTESGWKEKLAAAVDDTTNALAARAEFFFKDAKTQLELSEDQIRLLEASIKRLEAWSGIRRRAPRKPK